MKAVLVFVCFALIFCSSTVAINLQEALRSEPQFSSFTQHLAGQNPELWALLGDNTTTNTYTVFATLNNGAYVNNTSSDDLTYQVVSGSYNISEFIALETLPTLLYSKELGNATSQGTAQVIALSNINSTESWVINGEAFVRGPSVAARNGWVHGVSETILTPKINLTNIPEANTTLGKIIRKLDLVTAVLPPATFLIPTENNFAALFAKYPYYSNYLLGLNTTASRTNLQNIVNAHLIPQVLYPNDLAPYNISGPYPTLDSIESIRFDRTGNLSTKVIEVIDNANERFPITQPNVLAPNGVAHYIDGLIIPQNFQLTLEEVLNLAPTTEFFNALNAFKLTDTLLGLTDSTFFIPIGSANFTGATLEQLLLHVVPTVDAAFDGDYHHTLASLTTLNNRTQVVSLETETIYQVNTTIVLTTVKKVNGIPVTNLNAYPAKQNNTVYFIETVLELPGPPTNTLVNQHFSEFIQLVGFAGDNVAVNKTGVTIFAPTNDAVNSLQPGVLGYLTLANGSFYTEMVEAIIGNHIVENNILYEIPVAVNGTLFPTLNNNYPINITNNGAGRIVINGYATVANNSIPTQNGLIRPIDSVIIPTGLEFNLSSILIGLGNERFNNSADGYGSYNKFLDYLKVTGLLDQLSDKNEEYTIFAPTDEAFDQAVDNFAVVLNNATNPNTTIEVIEQLTTALNYHVIYNKDLANIVPMSNASFTYPVGVETNDTVVVDLVAPADNIKNYRVTLFTRTGINDNSTVNQGSGNLVLNTTTSYNQRIYGINRVLGIPVKASPTPAPSSDHHKGLTTAEWVLIGVGGAALGLILLLIVAGVVYYLLIRPKSGYRKIN